MNRQAKRALRMMIALAVFLSTPALLLLGLMAFGTISTALSDLVRQHEVSNAGTQLALAIGALIGIGGVYYAFYRFVALPLCTQFTPPRTPSRPS